MEKNKKQRDANIELLRCLAMLFIVIGHFYGHGFSEKGLTFDATTSWGWFNYVISEPIELLACCGVDIFVIITGYFLIDSQKMQWRKIAKIWLQVAFYSIILAGTFYTLNDNSSTKELLKSFIPIKSNAYWFVTKYVALIALAPFISRLAKTLNKKEYVILLLTMIFLTTEIYKFPYAYTYDEIYGTSLIFFITLFLIGGYIRLFTPTGGGKFVICFGLILIGIYIKDVYIVMYEGNNMLALTAFPYHSMTLIIATTFFIWFKGKNMKIGHRLALRIAPYTFGVYLFHENVYIRDFIWLRLVDVSPYVQSSMYLLYMMLCVSLIFIFGIIVDFIRSKIFSCLQVDNVISNFLQKIRI